MNADVAGMLTERLAGQAERDPFAALLLAQLNQAESTPDELDVLQRRLARATKVIERLRGELAAADRMAAHVARVLGACSACWGLDHFCRQCAGAGTPGSREPDLDGLMAWVRPALQRAGITTRTDQPTNEE